MSPSWASVGLTWLSRNRASLPSNAERTVAGSSRLPSTARTPAGSRLALAASRVSTATSAPRFSSSPTTLEPTVPVPPVTKTRMSPPLATHATPQARRPSGSYPLAAAAAAPGRRDRNPRSRRDALQRTDPGGGEAHGVVDEVGQLRRRAAARAAQQVDEVEELSHQRLAGEQGVLVLDPRRRFDHGGGEGALHRLHHLAEERLGRQLGVDQLVRDQHHPAPAGPLLHQGIDERGGEDAKEALEGGPTAAQLGDAGQPALAQVAQPAEKDLAIEVRLAPEVVVDRGDVALRLAGDVAHRRRVKTLLGEEGLGGVQQALAGLGALGVGVGGTVRHVESPVGRDQTVE